MPSTFALSYLAGYIFTETSDGDPGLPGERAFKLVNALVSLRQSNAPPSLNAVFTAAAAVLLLGAKQVASARFRKQRLDRKTYTDLSADICGIASYDIPYTEAKNLPSLPHSGRLPGFVTRTQSIICAGAMIAAARPTPEYVSQRLTDENLTYIDRLICVPGTVGIADPLRVDFWQRCFSEGKCKFASPEIRKGILKTIAEHAAALTPGG